MPDYWPESLPQYLETEGFSGGEPDNLLETPVKIPKTRPESSAAVRPVVGWMPMTLPQKNTLRDFGYVTLLQWAQPFWFPTQTSDSDPEMPGYWLVKFQKSGLPQYNAIPGFGGDLYNVPFKLWILPP